MSFGTRTESLRDATTRKRRESGDLSGTSFKPRTKPMGGGKAEGKRNSPKADHLPKSLPALCRELDGIAGRHATQGKACVMAGKAGIECGGRIDPAHVFKRGQRRHVRHVPEGILPVCRAHHDHYENRVPEWRAAIRDVKGAFYLMALIAYETRLKAEYGKDFRRLYADLRALYAKLAGTSYDVRGEGA